MALPNISGLTAEELRQLIADANLQYAATLADDEYTIETKKQQVDGAIDALEELLGPEGTAPSLTSIRGVLGYTEAQMAANSGLAIKLAFQGLEILTKTVLDVAYVVKQQ